jgi:hypothetical protein
VLGEVVVGAVVGVCGDVVKVWEGGRREWGPWSSLMVVVGGRMIRWQ